MKDKAIETAVADFLLLMLFVSGALAANEPAITAISLFALGATPSNGIISSPKMIGRLLAITLGKAGVAFL